MNIIRTLLLGFVLAMSTNCSSPQAADIVADSVRDFSGTQGTNGWSYGYWDRSLDPDGSYDESTDFRHLRHFGSDPINGLSGHTEFTTGKLWNLEDGRYYTSIWAEGGHPHGNMDLGSYAKTEQWVVRRWVSSVNGHVEIRGHAGKAMPWGENWSGTVKFLVVAGGNRIYEAEVVDGGREFTVGATVQVGTPVDFMIGPGSAIGVARFTATLTTSSKAEE